MNSICIEDAISNKYTSIITKGIRLYAQYYDKPLIVGALRTVVSYTVVIVSKTKSTVSIVDGDDILFNNLGIQNSSRFYPNKGKHYVYAPPQISLQEAYNILDNIDKNMASSEHLLKIAFNILSDNIDKSA